MESLDRINSYANNHAHVRKSFEVIQQALTDFGLDRICVSFNGGKDSTVVLHLVHSAIQNLCRPDKHRLMTFYFQSPDSFEEEKEFVANSVINYNLNIVQYSGETMKQSLAQFKNDHPNISAIFIGTRRVDLRPGNEVSAFSPTDNGWPEYVRVNPILQWSYRQVWDFIKDLELPYCSLYDQGYSSVGSRSNTKKNASLLRFDENGRSYHLPAWSLGEYLEERSYRINLDL